jgi:hypothetical protein
LPAALATLFVAAGAPAFAQPTLDAEELAFVQLVNTYRQQNGLQPLQVSVTLTTAAKWMSTDMGTLNYFDHVDSLGRDPFVRMAAFGYTYNTARAENIAAGRGTAQQAFDQWRNSPGHNSNMLGAAYRTMGIGRAVVPGSRYVYYWTNKFGGYVDASIPIGGQTTSLSHVLWTTDNRAQVVAMNGNTIVGRLNFSGPGPGWTAQSYARHINGSYDLLWSGNNQAMVWWINADHTWGAGHGYGGPGPGWKATSCFRNSDGSYHLLWSTDNQAQVWTVGVDNTLRGVFYLSGPGAGWTATSYFRLPDGSQRLAWTANNLAHVWIITPSGGWGGAIGFSGPATGWSATSYQVNADGSSNIVWTSNNQAQIWTVTATGGWGGMQSVSGPATGWTVQSYSK